MGKELYDAFPESRRVFERADEALGWSLSELCFSGPESELMLTAHTQPAILVTSIAALEALKAAVGGLGNPECAAGHSLGEYSALVAAGTLTLEDAVRLVHTRGLAMQEAVPRGEGGMAAFMGGAPEQIAAICEEAAQGEIVAPANYNAPGQIVVAGHVGAVARARALAADRGLKAIPLKVSAPFHCSLMASAAQAVEAALKGMHLSAPSFPVVSNVEAEPNSDSSKTAALLIRQVDAPVLWEQTVRQISACGVELALEIGPGKVLAGLVKRTAKNLRVVSVGDPGGVDKVKAELA
jgi:[acyl-carrier-protein] S-malonyltransferase